MVAIMVHIGEKIIPGARFEMGLRPRAEVIHAAEQVFDFEAEAAQWSANQMQEPITIKLIDTITGDLFASRTVTPQAIDSTTDSA